jgi:hypothetical protein
MKKDDYGDLIARITSLDTSTLTRLEADLTRLLTYRSTAAALAACPKPDLNASPTPKPSGHRNDDPTSSRLTWTDVEKTLPGARLSITEREKDPTSSRLSWSEVEKKLDQERHS